MNFYKLFYIVYEAIKINHCTHSYQLLNTVCFLSYTIMVKA